jgi:hypothetical protein
VKEVVGILAGGVEADEEEWRAVPLDDAFELVAEEAVAGGGLREGQFRGSRLEVVTQEAGVVAIARGVDADAAADQRW